MSQSYSVANRHGNVHKDMRVGVITTQFGVLFNGLFPLLALLKDRWHLKDNFCQLHCLCVCLYKRKGANSGEMGGSLSLSLPPCVCVCVWRAAVCVRVIDVSTNLVYLLAAYPRTQSLCSI